jgi:hypothetical protein
MVTSTITGGSYETLKKSVRIYGFYYSLSILDNTIWRTFLMKRKQKRVFDKEKSEYYGGDRKPLGRKGGPMKDKKRYNRKQKHKREIDHD